MHPVKVGVMDEEHEREGQNIIRSTILTYFPVQIGIRKQAPENYSGHSGKNQNRKKRIQDVPAIIFDFWEILLNSTSLKWGFEDDVENNKSNACYQEIAGGDILRNGKPFVVKFF